MRMDANAPELASDAELIGEVLKAAAQHRGRAIRDEIPGVTEHDVSRWNASGPTRLATKKRRAIISYLGGASEGTEGTEGSVGGFSAEALARQLQAIADLEVDETTRILARDSIAGAIRAQAALEAERARVEAERASRIRAEMLSQAEANAGTRQLLAEAERTGRIPTGLFRRAEASLPEQEEAGAKK